MKKFSEILATVESLATANPDVKKLCFLMQVLDYVNAQPRQEYDWYALLRSTWGHGYDESDMLDTINVLALKNSQFRVFEAVYDLHAYPMPIGDSMGRITHEQRRKLADGDEITLDCGKVISDDDIGYISTIFINLHYDEMKKGE
ncbi:MAG: hypothetical protein ACRCWB_11925 [Enterovibrio sp.]